MKKYINLDALKGWYDIEAIKAEYPEAKKVGRAFISSAPLELVEGERAAIQYITTIDKDSDNEIIDPVGVNYSRFSANPVVLVDHCWSAEKIVGNALDISVDPNYGVRAKTTFAETPLANDIWSLVKGGFLRSTSVGFAPLSWISSNDPDWAEIVQDYAKRWNVGLEHFAGVERIYTQILLLEFSEVAIPANPEALTVAVAKSMDLSDDVIKLLKIEETTNNISEEEGIDETNHVKEIIELTSTLIDLKSPITLELKAPKLLELKSVKKISKFEILEDITNEELMKMAGRMD